jgi:prefoldin subunit 5
MVGVGCDAAAIKSLEELTANLEKSANEQDAQLTALSGEVDTCKVDLAKVRKEATIIKQEGGGIDVPTLSGDRNLVTLEAHKVALNETIDKQKARIDELNTENEACAEELARARRKARAQKKKPEAVKIREAQGRETTGAGSRYKKRE